MRGGSTQTAPKKNVTGKQAEGEDFEEEEGYYDAGDGEIEYEYFEVDDDGSDAGEGYYYADEYYEGDGDEDEDGYVYLPDARDRRLTTTPPSKSRLLRPLASRATLSITGALPALVPAALSAQLGKASGILAKYVPGNMSVEASSLAALAMLAVVAVARALASSSPLSPASHSKKKRKKKKKDRKRSGVSHPKARKNFLWKTSGAKGDDAHNATVYGDYSKGYPGEETGDEDTLDLDLEEDCNNASAEQQCSTSLISLPKKADSRSSGSALSGEPRLDPDALAERFTAASARCR